MGIIDGIIEGLVLIVGVWRGVLEIPVGVVPLPRVVMSVGDWDDELRWGCRVATYGTGTIWADRD